MRVLDPSPLKRKLNSTSRKSFLQLSSMSVSINSEFKFQKCYHRVVEGFRRLFISIRMADFR